MPWLRKKPFQRLHVSSDYRDDDEVFHCEVTNEIFKDYNEFCERIILCNSTIWSCSITGKTNMTYEEALACEENAKESLKEFPMELRIPILYLASKMNRSSFSEMMEDIYQFARDRYFVGEMVEASFTDDAWCDCHILQVIEPSESQLSEYAKENPKQNSQERHFDPPAKLFRYEVEQLDDNDDDVTQIKIIDASQVRRKKQLFTRERCKIFLRMLCKQSNNGIWTVKDEIQRKYGIQKIRFDAIFAGAMPQFSSMPKRPVIKQQKQSTLDRFLTNDVSKQQQQQQSRASITIKTDPLRKLNEPSLQVKRRRRSRLNGKFNELTKAKALEEKTKRIEERLQKRVQQKEEKLKLAALAAYVKEWNKPREDLECEDLRIIPEGVPIKCTIPNKYFGDFVLILEFLQFFKEELEVTTYFTNGLTIEILEKALLTNEASGSWSDLLQLLLANIFKYQSEEEDEIHESNSSDDIGDNYTDHKVSSMAEAVKLATIASSWSQQHHGCQLSELTLDHVTLSEILRQHLLSSGGRNGELASKWRYSQRGGYTNHDDPALHLRINESRLLRCLGHRSICEFDLNDRLCIAKCLINQLLTFASIRDVIEERHEKLHQAKRELKLFLIAEQKKEREEKDRLREKEKEKEKDKDDEAKVPEEISEKPKKTRGSREEDKKREDYENKLAELRQASKDDQMMMYLGSDRAYRRYWRLISIPGIFVENDEQHSNSCIPDGTPYLPELQDKDAADIYLRNKFEDELSDKENSCNKTKKKKLTNLTDKIGVKLSRKDAVDVRRSLMACTDSKDCPVHCKRSEITWSFYTSQDDIDNLIKNLSIRGIREGELVNNLKLEYESINSLIKTCPLYKLNPELYPPENYANNNNNNNNSKVKKQKIENTNLNYPSEMEIDQVMELTLRDYVVEFEEKIRAGCLGTLKVKDRDAWKREILNPSNTNEDEPATNLLIDKIKNETRGSRPGTPDSEVGSGIVKVYRDPGKYLGPPGDNDIHPDPKQQAHIKQMAGAILQLFQAIEPKYFQKPLGADEKEKKQQQQDQQQQQQQQHPTPSEEIKERWEQSLLASTSWSQLFLHLNTLENSVAWGRSALNARCRICRKCRDAENMLLCDGCNKGQHLYCLKPKLTTVPEGDWFCSTCRPKETKPKAKKTKTRRKFEDEDDDEVITKDTKNHYAADNDEDDDKEIVKSMKKQEICSGCASPGSLIVCDTCPKLFHLDCVEPPLLRAPRGRWSCPECKDLRKSGARPSTLARGREREKETGRLCAAAARTRIHGFAKSLLSTDTSSWWDESSNSEETETRQTRRATKRAAAVQDKTLHDLLNEVMHHRDSWPFLSPVTADEVPDYYDFIKKPMDFGTIKKKLDNGSYDKNSQNFFHDIQLIFDNCSAYNKEHSTVYKAGLRLSKFFEKRSKEMGITGEETTRRSGPPAKKFKEDPEIDNDCTDKQIKINGNS